MIGSSRPVKLVGTIVHGGGTIRERDSLLAMELASGALLSRSCRPRNLGCCWPGTSLRRPGSTEFVSYAPLATVHSDCWAGMQVGMALQPSGVQSVASSGPWQLVL